MKNNESMSSPHALYRRLLREAKQMQDYNFRMYAVRRIRAGFDKNKTLSGYVSMRMKKR